MVDGVSAYVQLGQLDESVARLAAPPDVQRVWVDENDYPIRELVMDLDLAWPLWRTRLMAEGLVDDEDVVALDQLSSYSLSLVDPAHEHLFTWDAVHHAPEWEKVRKLAEQALTTLRRPRADKGEVTSRTDLTPD